jgi:hypothetical protein
MDTAWEEQISIVDESGNLPPQQEPSSGSEDTAHEEVVALGTPEATNVGADLLYSVLPPVLTIPNITFSSACVESSID